MSQLALEPDPSLGSDQQRGIVVRGFCPECGAEILELEGHGPPLDVREVEPEPGLVAFHGAESSWRVLGDCLVLDHWEIVLREHHCAGE